MWKTPISPMRAEGGGLLRRATFPQLRILLPLCAGIVSGRTFCDTLSPYTLWVATSGALLLLLSLLLHLRRHNVARMVAAVCLMSAITAGGMLLVMSQIDGVRTAWPNGARDYVVRVVSLPRAAARSTGVEAEVVRGDFAGKRIRLYLPAASRPVAGQRLLVHAEIQQPRPSGNPYAFDLPAYLFTQGISGTAYAAHWCALPQERSFSLRQWALRVQDAAVRRLQTHFPETESAMLAAMTVGDKRALTAEVREAFARTGTSHILALSGLHLGILFGLYQLLVLKRLHRRRFKIVAVAAGLCLVWLYALVAGMPLSLQRAAAMLSLVQVMQIARRNTLGLDRLLVAAMLILLCAPLALYDVGFQLSFLSVAAIMTLVPLFPELPTKINYVVRVVYSSLLTSLAAWLGTLPVVAYYFHTVSLTSLPANLLAVAVVMVLLALCALFFALPFAAGVLVPCMRLLLNVLTGVLDFFSTLPGSALELYPTGTAVWLTLAALVAFVLHHLRRNRAYAIGCVLMLCALVAEEAWAHRSGRLGSQLVFYNLWHGSALEAVRADGEAYLWTHGEGAIADFEYVSRDFHRRERIAPPHSLIRPYRDSLMLYAPPLLSFGGRRVAILCEKQPRMPQHKSADEGPAVEVDYLLVGKGYSGSPTESLQRYRRGLVVLDASLGEGYRRMWTAAADSLHRPFHDMKHRGALVVRLENE